MQKNSPLLILALLLQVSTVLAQKDGLSFLIKEPGDHFSDQRRQWVGKAIFFLRCEHVEIKNPYFDWYYDPANPDGSKPKRDELLYQYGRIEAVWQGQMLISRSDRNPYWRRGYFWQVRLRHNQKTIYFWDDNVSKNFNFGFVEDYEAAEREAGKVFWTRKWDSLYRFDNSGVIELANLEPVTLDSVAWGEYGSAPLKLILAKRNGDQGYLLYKNWDNFLSEWYIRDPRLDYVSWRSKDWDLIANRQLRQGMSPEMVLLSWGEPQKTRHERNKDQQATQLWIYEGVKETIYFLRFVEKKLRKVYWQN